MFLAVLLLLLPLSIDAQDVSFFTIPPHTENEDVIIAADDDSLIHLYCTISIGNAFASTTSWNIRENETFQDILFSASGNSLTHNFIESVPGTLPLNSNLTFNLTQATSQTKLSCDYNDNGVTFFIGILALPELSNVFANVTEGSSFNTSLAGPNNNPFPPPQGTWSYGDDPITSATISTNTYSIEFASAIRTQSGMYTLTLTNEAGTISGNVTLNVQYAPEGTISDEIVYTNLGDEVVLTAFTMFMANPISFQTWVSPSNNNINNESTQYSLLFSDTIQITINNVSASDIGVWTFGASNFIGNISANIDLVIAVPPGPPTNLSSSINGGTVSLHWIAPTEIGNPPITHYALQVTSTLGDVILVTSNNDTSFELIALVPNTQYNLTIRGESSIFPTTGDDSDILTFKTPPGPPDIRNATIISSDGGILANWTFRHIGGVDKEEVDVSVQCRPALQDAEIESGTGSGLAPGELKESCNGGNNHCIDDSYTGSIKVGPVEAGEVYICGMVASIDGHLDVFNLSDITTLTGIPSVPYGEDKCIGSELTFTVASKWAGITSESGRFRFNAFTSDGSINKTFDYMRYMNNQNVTINIGTISNKTTIYITAANVYGTSPVQSYEIQNICPTTLIMSQTMSTYVSAMVTPTPTVKDASTSTNIVIIIVPVVTILFVIAIATVLVTVVVILMIKKKKTGKMKVTAEVAADVTAKVV